MEQDSNELCLYALNDGELFRRMREPIERALRRRMDNGTYDHEKALVAWKRFADVSAKRYAVEVAAQPERNGLRMFSVATRLEAAREMCDSFLSEERAQGTPGAGDAYKSRTRKVSR